ncbi:MAG: carboxypeptidase-like regulatory domain-containing protein [Terriglobales bacterium]|jgi:hypothetical protein
MKLKSAQILNVTFHVCERPELFREGLVAVVNWRNRIRLTVVAIFTIVNAFMHGQSTLATLRGSVRDASGAAIVQETVTLRNAGTQVSRETRTDEAGVYILFDLPPSRYEITVATPGFAIQPRTDVEFTVKAEEVVHFNLYPATIESSVEVHAEGHGIDLESAALTRVVDPRAMRELPLNGPGLDSACAVGARRLGHSHSECTERKQLQSQNPPVWFSSDNWRSRPGQNSYLLSQNDMRTYPT